MGYKQFLIYEIPESLCSINCHQLSYNDLTENSLLKCVPLAWCGGGYVYNQ